MRFTDCLSFQLPSITRLSRSAVTRRTRRYSSRAKCPRRVETSMSRITKTTVEVQPGDISMDEGETVLGNPIAVRVLEWNNGDRVAKITVTIWAPQPSEDHFACEYAAQGLPTAIRSFAYGEDSLQALFLAFTALRNELAPYRDQLSFLGLPREHGIPLCVPLLPNANDARHLESLLENEVEYIAGVAIRAATARLTRLSSKYGLPGAESLRSLSIVELSRMLSDAAVQVPIAHDEGDDQRAYVLDRHLAELTDELRARTKSADAV